jgi:hypothetical protein
MGRTFATKSNVGGNFLRLGHSSALSLPQLLLTMI